MAWFGSATNPETSGKTRGLPPVAPVSLLGSTLPPDASQARSNATRDALLAAKKARAKASGGSLLTAPAPVTTPAVLAPKSLVGS